MRTDATPFLNSDFTNKKMKRLTFILLVLVLLLSSCTQEQAPQSGVCDVMLEIVQEKNITATQMDVISYYRYDAHITGGSVSTEGQATNEILVVKDGLANIGSLAQGLWTITVRAYSLRNTVLYEGSVSLYVGSSAFTARIVLSQHTGIDGHVSIDIMTIKTAEENPALLAEWASLDGQVSDLWSVWTTESGSPDPEHVRFSGVLAIPEGRYNLTLSLYGNTKLSCSVTDLMVVGNDTTYVSGYLNPGTDVQLHALDGGPSVDLHVAVRAGRTAESPRGGGKLRQQGGIESDAACFHDEGSVLYHSGPSSARAGDRGSPRSGSSPTAGRNRPPCPRCIPSSRAG